MAVSSFLCYSVKQFYALPKQELQTLYCNSYQTSGKDKCIQKHQQVLICHFSLIVVMVSVCLSSVQCRQHVCRLVHLLK